MICQQTEESKGSRKPFTAKPSDKEKPMGATITAKPSSSAMYDGKMLEYSCCGVYVCGPSVTQSFGQSSQKLLTKFYE